MVYERLLLQIGRSGLHESVRSTATGDVGRAAFAAREGNDSAVHEKNDRGISLIPSILIDAPLRLHALHYHEFTERNPAGSRRVIVPMPSLDFPLLIAEPACRPGTNRKPRR